MSPNTRETVADYVFVIIVIIVFVVLAWWMV